MRNILVCLKAVPDVEKIRIDEKTGNLVRAGVPCTVNPLDAEALELALRIRDSRKGCRVLMLSMGMESAAGLLRECLAAGADEAFLICGEVFGGSDTLATSYALSCAVRYLSTRAGEISLILCGMKSVDGETAQVGPELAEHLDIPQITGVTGFTIGSTGRTVSPDRAEARRETDEGTELVGSPLPCLVTVAELGYSLRCPTVKNRIAARRATVHVIRPEELEIDLSKVGRSGSPTKVKGVETPEFCRRSQILQADSGGAAAEKLMDILCRIGAV